MRKNSVKPSAVSPSGDRGNFFDSVRYVQGGAPPSYNGYNPINYRYITYKPWLFTYLHQLS